MKKKYVWTRSIRDDIWHGGLCDSIKNCIVEAKCEGYQDTDTIALGYALPYEVNHIDGDYIIEYLQENAYDEVGEVSDSWLDSITREQREDLENRLIKVILDWMKDCKEEPCFYTVEPFDELTIKEALRKYGEQKKGGE